MAPTTRPIGISSARSCPVIFTVLEISGSRVGQGYRPKAPRDRQVQTIFINHGWNVHLDASYTVFAEIVSGMDVAD